MSKRSLWDTELGLEIIIILIPFVLVLGPVLLLMLAQLIMTGRINWV